MGQTTEISWCDATYNPWWGCSKVSPACLHCYAESLANRFKPGLWGVNGERRFFGDAHWNEPLKWARKAKAAGVKARVFCGSMCDYLEDRRDLDGWRERLWELIEETAADLDWLLLTKRADILSTVPSEIARRCWMGVTVEDQARADERIPHLLRCPAAVRFLSVEPLLEAVNLRPYLLPEPTCSHAKASAATGETFMCGCRQRPGIGWVIVGGESGPKARPFDLAWARSIRDHCRAAGTAFFLKQMGARQVDAELPLCDGETQGRWFYDRSGRDPAEWPADLNCREFPEVTP